MSAQLIEGYTQIILHSKVDFEFPRLGTYTKKMKEVQTNMIDKDTKKKAEKVIDSILKELGMSRKEFEEVKGIALEMKASGKTEILIPIPIAMAGPTVEVTIAQPSVQEPTVPYAIFVQQQSKKKEKEIVKEKSMEEIPLAQRKFSRLGKTKIV